MPVLAAAPALALAAGAAILAGLHALLLNGQRVPADIAAVPAGLHVLVPNGQRVPATLLDDARVSTIVLRSTWPAVEPEPQSHDWTHLETELERVARAGKAASLVINAGGVATPAWLRPQLQTTVRLRDGVRFHATHGQWLEIPTFWDPALLAAKGRLIAAAGARLTGAPALALVSVQCANATTDDWNIPADGDNAAAWRAAGFSTQRLLQACTDLVDATAAAFPRQTLRMAIGRVPPALADGDPDALARALMAHARDKWPGRFVVQRHNLSAHTPQPTAASGWRVVAEACPDCAAQFLAPAVDTRSCRLAGGQGPCEAAAMFRAAAASAIAMGLRYVEVYGADLKDPALAVEVGRLAAGLVEGPAGAPTIAPDTARRAAPPPGAMAPAERPGAGLRRGPPPPRAGGSSGAGRAVQVLRLESAAFGRPVDFGLWLPPGYETGDQRYPVLYWLHGKGGDPRRSARLVRYAAKAVAEGILPPMLVVFPDGDLDSFYTDSLDGRSPVETMVIRELIPHVDRHYRTRAVREGRHIEGFSMGGFGALKFAAKYPELFSSVVAYGAPRLDAELGLGGGDRQTLDERFGGDIERFRRETPAWWFTKNRDRLREKGLRIRLVAGSADGTRHSMARMHEILERLGLPHEYAVLDGVPHVPMAYYEADREAGYALHAGGRRRR